MSTFISLSHEFAQVTSTHAAMLPAAGGDGVLDWLTNKNAEAQTLLRAFAVTAGILFVIIQAVASRGAMARIIISALAAGVFVWVVWNITDLKDRVGNEVGQGSSVVHTTSSPTDSF